MNGPLKWHGGKHYLANRIVSLMPPHIHYVELYAGGLAVLLRKPCDGISEVVNDLNGELTNFWRVLQHEKLFAEFHRRVQAMPFSEAEWRDALHNNKSSQVDRTVSFFVRCRQNLAGRCEHFAPITRNRTRRRMNEQASAWLNAVDGLPAVHARLRRVLILNRPAVEVIRSQDGPNTLFYLDPPYLCDTRTSPEAYGEHEMSKADHEELIDAISDVQGCVMISGYRSHLYDARLRSWYRVEFELPNNASGGMQKPRMTEVVWCNFNIEGKETTNGPRHRSRRRRSLLVQRNA